MKENVFDEIGRMHTAYHKRIIEATQSGCRETLAALCDEYMRFLCDASRELLVRSRKVERLVERFPKYREMLEEIMDEIVEGAQTTMGCFKKMEMAQKRGAIPTNLPDIEYLLAPNPQD